MSFFFLLLLLLPAAALARSEKVSRTSTAPVSVISKEDLTTMPTLTVVGSRLPAFKVPFADVPANVSYIPANVTRRESAEIYSTQPRTVQESLQDAEGSVLYDAVGNGLDTTYSLRGFADSSAVIVLLDGVRVNELDGNAVTYPLLRLDDLESLQIDRGSASNIYGDNAFAGVLHLTTGQPSPKPLSLFGGFEVSSFHGLRFHQGFSGTLEDKVTPLGGKWGYYFNGGRDVGDGFRANGESRITNFDFKTFYELPDDQGRVHFGVKHVEDAVSNPGELTFDQFQRDPHRTNKPLDGRQFKNTIVSMGADKKFWDDKLLASVFASWRYNHMRAFTTTASFADFVTGSDPDTDFISTRSRSTDLIWQLAYMDEWKDVKHRAFLGMEFRDGANDAVEKDAFGGHVNLAAATETQRDADTYNTGLFWRESMEFYDRVIVHAGMRHDFHWLKSDNMLDDSADLSNRWRNSSVSTGVTVKVTQSAETFFNYSQGFRVPTIDEIAPFSGTLSAGLRPVKSDSYEVGSRLRWKDLAIFKASYFLIDLHDEILFDSTTRSASAPFGQNVNIGESRRTGVELRVDGRPVPEADVYGSYTWTQAWNRETNPEGTLPDGRALGQIPENRAAWGLVVTPFKRFDPFGFVKKPEVDGKEWDGTAYGLRVGVHGTFTGHQHPTDYESTAQSVLDATGGAGHWIKSYTLWDFILSYFWRETEFYFKITNIFDNKYYSRAVDATSFGTAIYPAGDYTFVNPGAPREYYGGVRWKI